MNHAPQQWSSFQDTSASSIHSSTSSRPVRRITMDHSQPNPVSGTSRGARSSLVGRTTSSNSNRSATRGITRNISSRPSRRSTLDHASLQVAQVGRSNSGVSLNSSSDRQIRGITRNISSRPARRTTIDHHSVGPPRTTSGRTGRMVSPRSVSSRSVSEQQQQQQRRRITMDLSQPSCLDGGKHKMATRKISMNMTASTLSRGIPTKMMSRRSMSPARCA